MFFTYPLHSERYDLSALKWRNIGPNRGGRSQACAGSTRRPLEYYFGATGGGLWKTTNGGVTWFPVTDGQIKSSSVGAIAVSESNPDVVYLGMGETELRGSIMQGDGVYKSSDAGKTWKHIGLSDTQAVSRIRIDPANPDLVYVAALGHPYGPSPERGVFRSSDGGSTWKRVLFKSDRAGAIDLAMDAHHPRVLFATIWDVYRTPWSLSSGGPASGFFKSTDGGDNWTEITRNPGLPKGILGKITVTVSGADGNRIYALVEADDGGLFSSHDAGATWTMMTADRSIRQRAFYFSRILADPQKADTVYAMNVEFYRSDDGGKTFQTLHTPHADHHDLWIAPDNPQRMVSSDDGGGAVSTDGAKTWTLERYPTAQFYHIGITAEMPYHVCGAQQDDGTACVPSDRAMHMRDPGGTAGDWLYSAGGGEAGYVAPDPTNPNIFYGGDQAGIITRYDRRTGQSRAINVYPLFFSGMSAAVLRDRWQWTFPIVFSPLDPKIIYTSSQRLWRTTTQGQHWDAISPDLTRNDPKTLGDSGGPITKDQNGPEIYGTIFSIAPSYHDVNTVWTGSDDGLVQLTRDGGKTWTNVTPPGLGEFNRISLIEASPHDPAGAYVAAKRYQLDDRRPYLFRTHDYGKTWAKIVDGIPGNDFAQAIREDTERRGLLFAGTEHGIYVSYNDGSDWQSLSLNLPDTQVADIAIAHDDLVIATYGRSFYVLDNIGILRQSTPEIANRAAYLFKPAPVIRPINAGVIDYFLAKPAAKVIIEILDDTGQTIRSFDSTAARPGRAAVVDDPGDGSAPSSGPASPGSKAGTNRFVWDVRYAGPVVFPGIVLRYASPGQGPVAPPGQYSVRLIAGGETQTQPLIIQRDPRLTDVSDADLREQFKLAMRIRDQTSRAHEAVIQIRKAKETASPTLKSKLDEVELDLDQVKNRSPRDTLNYPIKLNNQLAVLQRLVDMGESRPTDQDYAVFEELTQRLNQILARLKQIMGK
ncbi:MAG: glycosyl hydrolase [Acidobacteriota bacterium]|nr:glycosyl hydrolase [Acidobacteriota bacterium]